MTTPLYFHATFRVRDGHTSEELAPLVEGFTGAVGTASGTIGLQLFLDEAGTELTYVQLNVDAAAMDAHLERSHDRIAAVIEIVEPVAITVGGTPGPLLRDVLAHLAETGAVVTRLPHYLGGRLAA